MNEKNSNTNYIFKRKPCKDCKWRFNNCMIKMELRVLSSFMLWHNLGESSRQTFPQTFMTIFTPNCESCSSTPGKLIEKPVLILTVEIPLVFYYRPHSCMGSLYQHFRPSWHFSTLFPQNDGLSLVDKVAPLLPSLIKKPNQNINK